MSHWTVADNIISVDFGAKDRQLLEQQAIEIMNAVMSGDPVPVGMEPVIHIEIPYGGQGIDGMWTDTAPSEYCAPEKDPA